MDHPILLALPLFGALFLALGLAGCASLPKPTPAWSVRRQVDTTNTAWARAIAPAEAEHPGDTGIELLRYGMDAFSARLALADSAERTLDIQYYMWKPDAAGWLLAERLINAADRGVHVRLLLDDIGGSTSDSVLLALDSHTNIEVRIFNPIANRTFRSLNWIFNFHRINRRMHNKSFTADRIATIVGGRNVEIRYYAPGDEPMFADLDVLAAGPAAADVATMFDRFWFNPLSIPIHALQGKAAPEAFDREAFARLTARARSAANTPQFDNLDSIRVGADIRVHEPPIVWGNTTLISDRPEKASSDEDSITNHLFPKLRGIVSATTNEFLVVSPYFVPGPNGVELLRSLRERGVHVIVLSNSLASTDVIAVHAGYRRYRKELLRAGVDLWEFKPDATIDSRAPEPARRGRARDRRPKRTALHAKSFAFDRSTLFVGSLNVDPRSAALNTEMGFVMRMPALARDAADNFETNLIPNAYRLEFVPSSGPCKECGSIVWHSEEHGKDVKYTHEPKTSIFLRLYVRLLSLLPIESQL